MKGCRWKATGSAAAARAGRRYDCGPAGDRRGASSSERSRSACARAIAGAMFPTGPAPGGPSEGTEKQNDGEDLNEKSDEASFVRKRKNIDMRRHGSAPPLRPAERRIACIAKTGGD